MGGMIYRVSWVIAPNGSESPFALATRYGYLIFVFWSNDDLFQLYHDISAEVLPPGFSLETAALICDSEYEVTPMLMKDVPVEWRANTSVIIEGTRRFDQLMAELGTGEIFGDS